MTHSSPRSARRRRATVGAGAAVAIAALVGPAALPAAAQEAPEVTATADETGYGAFDTAEEFVEQLYRDLLRREATAGEVSTEATRLEAGLPPEELIVELLATREADTNLKSIVRLYRAYFLRNPDQQGMRHWIARRQEGIALQSVSNEFAKSPEFSIRYGRLDDAGFVDRIYENVLDRQPDQKGRQYWLDQLAAGLYRGQLVTRFSEAPEYVAKTEGTASAVLLYSAMFDRSIPRGLSDAYGPSLTSGRLTVGDLAAQFLADGKYLGRF